MAQHDLDEARTEVDRLTDQLNQARALLDTADRRAEADHDTIVTLQRFLATAERAARQRGALKRERDEAFAERAQVSKGIQTIATFLGKPTLVNREPTLIGQLAQIYQILTRLSQSYVVSINEHRARIEQLLTEVQAMQDFRASLPPAVTPSPLSVIAANAAAFAEEAAHPPITAFVYDAVGRVDLLRALVPGQLHACRVCGDWTRNRQGHTALHRSAA